MKYALLMILSGVLIFAGCNQKEGAASSKEITNKASEEAFVLTYEEKQDVILQFVNEDLARRNELEDEAFASLEIAFDFPDGQAQLDELKNTTIPTYEKAVQEVDNIKPEITELEDTHHLMHDLSKLFMDYLQQTVAGIEKGDNELLEEAESTYEEYLDVLTNYHKELIKVATKYDIEYEPYDFDLTGENGDITAEQQAFLTFVNEDVAQVAAYEHEAIHNLDAITGDNDKDEETVYQGYINDVIPAFEKALEATKQIEPGIEALKKPKALLVEANEAYLLALEMRAEAIKKNDRKLDNEARKKGQENQQLLEAYHEALGELAEKFDGSYETDQYKGRK